MKIMSKLTMRHLGQNKGRTLVTILSIMLSVAMVCSVAGFVMSVRDVIYRITIESNGDYHIAYRGLTAADAEKIAADDLFSAHFIKENEDAELVTLFVKFEHPGKDYLEAASHAAEGYAVQGISAHTEQLALEGVIAPGSSLMAFVWIAVMGIVIIVSGSVIVIANSFYISTSERVRQFGLLKSVGATKAQIAGSILFEALLLACLAIPLGIAFGFLIQAAVLSLTNGILAELNEMNNHRLDFRVVFHPVIIYVAVVVSAVTLLISAWLPALRATKTSPIDAIRQTREVKIRQRNLQTSRFTEKLFGFEGMLAAKSLKRNRTKYRATVISLTVSIVLFVSLSSLVWVINKAVDLQYGGYDFDVFMTTAEDLTVVDGMERQLATIPEAQIARYQYLSPLESDLPVGFLTEKAANQWHWVDNPALEQKSMIRLIAYPDSEFAGIAPPNQGELSGILINASGKVMVEGKPEEYAPFNYQAGMTLTSDSAGNQGEDAVKIRLAAALSAIPDHIPQAFYDGTVVNILLPESALRGLTMARPESFEWHTVFTIVTANPDAFCERARELLPNEDELYMNNVSQMTRMSRDIVLTIMLFGYGFIAMLSLIAVTSVISTISTNMALRRKEFAMLSSVGMTPGGMNKMLNLESLMYGARSLAIGLPLGVALSYLIYRAMSNAMGFQYQLPLNAMIISTVAVLLLTFCTMRYSKGKLRKDSIVEAIRSEIV